MAAEITPREVQQSHRIGKKQAAHADQDSAGELAVRVRRIHHLGQSRRNQDHRPIAPHIVEVDNAQIVQQKEHSGPGHDETWNESGVGACGVISIVLCHGSSVR